ncbi:MAG: hypothetical protein Q9186_003789 [Xanthomendoza sp. 1 TL-2023]
MASKGDVDWGSPGSSDADTVSLTSTKLSSTEDEYELEGVLAERTNKGEMEYLVKWKDYPHYRNTWEKEQNFFQAEQTLLDWNAQKMRISRGHTEAFDVPNWECESAEFRAATQKRRARRREKKIALGIPVPSPPPQSSDQSYSSDESTEARSREDSDGSTGSDSRHEAPSLVWTPKEEATLLEALQRLRKPQWDTILEWHGPAGIASKELQHRTEGSLRRKALAMKRDFDASGKEFPIRELLDIPSSKSAKSKLNNELVESLKGIERSGNADAKSPRKRKSDQHVSPRVKKPEKPKIRVPASSKKVSELRSAPPTLSSQASPQFTPIPSRPLSRSNTTVSNANPRPTQLGIVGRGPARTRSPPAKVASKQPPNIFGNWGAQPTKRRKSRYEMLGPKDAIAKNPSKFKKLSTQRKFELAGRYEHTPDVNSLTFLGKGGRILDKPPASVARKPPEKTPFQLLKEKMNEKQDEALPTVDETVGSRLERTSTTESYPNKPGILESGNSNMEGNEVTYGLGGSTAPLRRASLPFETYTQRKGPSSQPFTAPVAMMGSGQVQTKSATPPQRRLTPEASISAAPKTDEVEKPIPKTVNSTLRRASISAPHETVKRTVIGAEPGGDTSDSINDTLGNGAAADSRKEKAPVTLQRRASQSRPILHSPVVIEEVPEPIAQPQNVLPNFQPREDGYALFPLDFAEPAVHADMRMNPYSTDVIAEILVGLSGHSTDKVIFRGLDEFSLKSRFLSIRVPPRQMHVKCETMCTAGEYATFLHDKDIYLGSGYIVPFHSSMINIDELCKVLIEHASGGLFFAEDFSLLIYPTRCVGWDFLDSGFLWQAPPEAKLRFAMLTPWPQLRESTGVSQPQIANIAPSIGLSDVSINRLFQERFSMDFRRLVAQASDRAGRKTRPTNAFFLIFPSLAQQEFDLLVEWICTNNRGAEIYRYGDQGAWTFFQQSVDNGVIICHASFYDYWAMPYLAFVLRKTINMFNFSLEPMSPLGPDPHLIRLFPAGQAILLTDSLFLLRPIEAAQILSWFRLYILPTKAPRSWKVCTRPAIREWLLKLQEQFNYPHGKNFVLCYGEIMRLLPGKMTKEWEREVPKDNAPIACMGEGVSEFDQSLGTSNDLDHQIIMNNDVTLMSWFAGWAMMKQEKFRRFHVITGRTEESEEHKKLKHAAKKYNHIAVMSFEKYAGSQAVWDWTKIEEEDGKKRGEARKVDEEMSKEEREEEGEQSPDLPDYEDEEMLDEGVRGEESLFLPMDISSSPQKAGGGDL